MGRVFHGASFPRGEFSTGRVVHGMSCPWNEFFMGQNDCMAKCHGASCPGIILATLAHCAVGLRFSVYHLCNVSFLCCGGQDLSTHLEVALRLLYLKWIILHLGSGGKSYSYSVTKLHKLLLFVVTSNVFVTF
jgi:hypothetical protein